MYSVPYKPVTLQDSTTAASRPDRATITEAHSARWQPFVEGLVVARNSALLSSPGRRPPGLCSCSQPVQPARNGQGPAVPGSSSVPRPMTTRKASLVAAPFFLFGQINYLRSMQTAHFPCPLPNGKNKSQAGSGPTNSQALGYVHRGGGGAPPAPPGLEHVTTGGGGASRWGGEGGDFRRWQTPSGNVATHGGVGWSTHVEASPPKGAWHSGGGRAFHSG